MGERLRPLEYVELFMLGLAVDAGAMPYMPNPDSGSAEVFEELADAGLLRRTGSGYRPTEQGRRVVEAWRVEVPRAS